MTETLILTAKGSARGHRRLRGPRLTPPRLIVLSFFTAILTGTVLLKIPASVHGPALSWLDALFMATSAVCVTGLTVINIGAELTAFGQCVLLALIQIGGLGIMTFSVFFLLLVGRHASFRTRMSLGYQPHHAIQSWFNLLIFVILMTLTFEVLGALLMYPEFYKIYPPHEALFYSIFHSVSAFCNSGFSLFADSLTGFQNDGYLLSVFMFLVVAGGLGFMVIEEVRSFFAARLAGQKSPLSLQSKICLVWSIWLIVFGALSVLVLEYHNLLKNLPWPSQLINAVFLSVTSRTAGFHSIETGQLTDATLQVVMILMFIGGCSGSTAGGIKVTTFMVLIALIKDQIRGRASTSVFRRRIPQDIVAKSLAIFAAAFIVVNLAVLLLEITENIGISHLIIKKKFLDLAFEVFSALGTVGLSTGLTPELTAGGKFLIILLMFAGRVGPLTIGLALVRSRRQQLRFEYTEESIAVG